MNYFKIHWLSFPLLRSLALFFLIIMITSCASLRDPQDDSTLFLPAPEREFRAAWVATVANINWPSKPGLSVKNQKEEALFLLDLLKENNFNAVIFQVRPQGDALYKSELEPWSYYLSGIQGVGSSPDYDPLQFWIEEAHKRRLELHVWLNPYRAHHPDGGPVSKHSVVNTKSNLVLELKNGYHWFDPSLKGTQDHSHAVVMDIVKRYDVDGVHFDDYFYPYPSYNDNEDFPDSLSWNIYKASGGKLSRGDWRRKSVDTFIERVYRSIKVEKPYVKFGLSPFGIWRPNHPTSIKGFDQYDVLYADAKKWLNEGWVDYFTPQLYWPINRIPQSFPVLLGWWESENSKQRHLWPGVSIGRLSGDQQRDEIVNLIMITRGMLPKAPGMVHWSIQPLVESDSLRAVLREGPYATPALIPEMNWLKKESDSNWKKHSNIVDVTLIPRFGNIEITFKDDFHLVSSWIIQAQYENRVTTKLVSSNTRSYLLPYTVPKFVETQYPDFSEVEVISSFDIHAVDRFGYSRFIQRVTLE